MRNQPTTIYLVRHAEVHNPNDIIYGRLPRFRLSDIGREQAERTAHYLASIALSAVYSSPQLRARQTAAAIAARQPGLRVHRSGLLAEIKTSWEGTSSAILGRDFNFYEPLRSPGDESIADIFGRVQRLVSLTQRRHDGRHIACVTHGDVIMAARAGLAGQPLVFASLRGAPYPRHGSVTIFRFSNPGLVVSYIDPASGKAWELSDS